MGEKGRAAGRCDLCEREVPRLTRHHLIPRMRHRRGSARRSFSREEMQGRIALLCEPCHKQVHIELDVAALEQDYNTVDRLRAHPGVARFLAWIRDKPGSMRLTAHRPRGSRRGRGR